MDQINHNNSYQVDSTLTVRDFFPFIMMLMVGILLLIGNQFVRSGIGEIMLDIPKYIFLY